MSSPAWAFPLAALAILAIGLLCFERGTWPLHRLPVVAVLAAAAASGRIALAFIPSVQPVTFLVMLGGLVFGPSAGFMIGVIAAVGSNFFLGQGLWTLWQALAWGLCGASLGWIGRIRADLPVWILAAIGCAWGFLFGWLQNLWQWLAFAYPLNWPTWLAVNAASLPFDAAHAAANAFLFLAAGPAVIRILRRHRDRMPQTS